MNRLLLTLLSLLAAFSALARHYDFSAQRISAADGLPTNVVIRIWQDEEGYMLFETRNGFCRYDGYTLQPTNGVAAAPEQTAELKTREATWQREGKGRLARQGTDGTTRSWQLIPDDIITYTRNDHFHVADVDERTEAVSTYGSGLYLYDKPTGELTQLTKESTNGLIDDNYLTGLFVDRTGCIWLVEDYLGVKCLRMNQLHYTPLWLAPQATIQDANYIRCIAKTDSTHLLVSNQMGEVYLFDTTTGETTFLERQRHRVYAALLDSRGRLWTGTRGGGLFCNGKRIEGLPSPHIFNIREGGDGSILVSMLEGGVVRLHNNGKQDLLLGGKNAHDAQTDREGRLWAATEEGLYVLDALSEATDSVQGCFTCLHMDRKGTVWAGTTDRGLLKAIHAPHPEVGVDAYFYQKDHGLPTDDVYSIAEDATGCLWLGTEDGLAQLDPATHIITNHHISDRPLSNVFCERAAVSLSDGRLLFGSHLGMVMLTPGEPTVPTPPATAVTGLVVNGELMVDDTPLSYRQNNVTLRFSNFQYARQQGALYQYFLEGADKDWNAPTAEHEAVYRNLSPGHYRFHVRTVVGGSSGKEATLSFQIRQPWWNTWWAWLIYLLAALIGFALILRLLRLRRRLEIERRVSAFERDFYSRIERELRNPINVVQGAVENVQLGGTSKTTVQSLRRSSKRVLKLMDMLRQFHRLNDIEMQIKAERANMDAEAEQHFRNIQQSIRAEEEELKELAPPPINDQTILIVESDEDTLTHLTDTLNPYFRIVACPTMEQAMTMISEERPSLLLMDITDDEKAGRDTTKAILADYDALPVIHLSASDADIHQLRSLRSGAADYIVKPFSGKVLLERITKILRRAESSRLTDGNKASAAEETAPQGLLTDVKDKKFLDRFQTVLASHVSDENFSVEQFASLLNLGRTQFYKKVKALTGETPVQHLHRARLDYAARLLRESTVSVEEVMNRAGFSSPTHFYKAFKRQFGVSPRLYRNLAS